jgi:hypothetical protein
MPLNTSFTAQFSFYDRVGPSTPTEVRKKSNGIVKFCIPFTKNNNSAEYYYYFKKGTQRNTGSKGKASWEVKLETVPPDGSNKVQ